MSTESPLPKWVSSPSERLPQVSEDFIPKLLQDYGYTVTLEEYVESGGQSEKLLMFQRIAEVNEITKEVFGFSQPAPHATPITHKLWTDYCKADGEIPNTVEDSLLQLFKNNQEISSTGKNVLRHAESVSGKSEDTGAPSYPGLTSPEETLEHLKRLFDFFRFDNQWNPDDPKYEVAVNLQTHADPNPMQTRTRKDGKEVLIRGTPPIGFVVTTDPEGEAITVQLAIGDNRTVQTIPSVTDTYFFTFSAGFDENGSIPILQESSPAKPGSRKSVIQDLSGKLVETVILSAKYRHGLIPVSNTEIGHVAVFAAVAARLFKGEKKVEGSLNTNGRLEINQLSDYTAPPKDQLKHFKGEYQVLTTLNSIKDTQDLADFNPNELLHTPTLIIGSELTDSTEVAQTMLKVQKIIDDQIAQSDESTKELWKDLLILAEGNSTSHRLKPIVDQTNFRRLIRLKLPVCENGDTLSIQEGRSVSDIWVNNRDLSGDNDVIAPAFLPKAPPRLLIGPKAAELRETEARLGIPTAEYNVATSEFFMKTLEHCGALETWNSLVEIKDEGEFVQAFQKIRSSLTSIPEELWQKMVTNLRRIIPNADNMLFVARSTNLLEDLIDSETSNKLAGALESFLGLKLDPDNKELSKAPGNPTNVASGILQVMASGFTEKLAKYIFNDLSPTKQQEFLANWKMPVIVSRQINSRISGTSTPCDPDTGNTDLTTLVVQSGLGGGVGGNDGPLLQVRLDAQTHKIVSATYQENARGNPVEIQEPINNIQNIFPDIKDIGELEAIANITRNIRKLSGHEDNEWAIEDTDGGLDSQVFFLQSR